jgi:hypothetical protein
MILSSAGMTRAYEPEIEIVPSPKVTGAPDQRTLRISALDFARIRASIGAGATPSGRSNAGAAGAGAGGAGAMTGTWVTHRIDANGDPEVDTSRFIQFIDGST